MHTYKNSNCLIYLFLRLCFGKQLLLCFTVMLTCTPIYSQAKRALLVGISDYPQKEAGCWTKIHGANDVELLSSTLRKQGFETKLLTNKTATAKGIRNQLNSFTSSCKKGDVVYIHFSCHGQPVEDLNGDEEDGWDEAIIPYDAQMVYETGKYEGKSHILDDELNGFLKSIRGKIGPKGFVYVVIDACHAGSSYRGEEDEDSIIVRGTNSGFSASGKQFVPKIDKRGRIKVEKSSLMADICVIEACRSYQVNSEIREGGTFYGSLSFYVNKVLQITPLDSDKSWIDKVSRYMDSDVRLIRQNMVLESSL